MPRYSHSRIDTFKQCPKKYELNYVRRIPRTSRGIEAYMGSRVHDALEWLYEHVCMGRIPEVTEVLERYRAAWDREWDPCVRVVREGYTPTDYRVAGERLIKDYYLRHHPFDADTTVGLEVPVQLQLDNERVLRGFVDRLVKVCDGVWEIHDYKTSRKLPTQAQADADRQLALYQLAVAQMYPEARDVTLVWHYLFHDTEVRSTRTADELQQLLEEVRREVAQIEAAEVFPTNISRLCDWCDWRAACPAWSHEAGIEERGTEMLADDDDVALVERYAAVCDTLRALKSERESLRDELLTRMRDGDLDALAGTEHRVRVTRAACYRIPSPDDAARRELETHLKEAGLWDRFSMVNARALGEALQGSEIPEESVRRISQYVTMESSETLRSSKR